MCKVSFCCGMESKCGDATFLTMDALLHIFSYLEAEDLLRVSFVNKFWNEAAQTEWLWRNMCLQRWTFCNPSLLKPGMQTWRNYYLHRSKLEKHMISGRSSTDYTCKTLRGHDGQILDLVCYSEGSNQSDPINGKSIVCTTSTDSTLRAWDIKQGIQLWSSPVQNAPFKKIAADHQKDLIISLDSQGTVKTWQVLTGKEVSSVSTCLTLCTLSVFSIQDQSYLIAGADYGVLRTFTVPELSQVSHVEAFPGEQIHFVLVSPDKQWIITGVKANHNLCAKVYLKDDLSNPSNDCPPLSSSLPVPGCEEACFLPCEAARVLMAHCSPDRSALSFSTFDIKSKKNKRGMEIAVEQVGHFQPQLNSVSGIILEARGSDTIVFAQGQVLWVYTITGEQIGRFQDHNEPITALCVDSFRVVTASSDLSLRVLTWKKEKGLTLVGRYHLLGGSHTTHRGLSHVVCDYANIVTSAVGRNHKDVLKVYSFQ
ncbi:F-box/WD repeat-containing protein 12 [Erpetoichthys calabaricus]|uniref:F-box/WD repeat-containing protein 12 n=1 Tax=Erpetoichthys calabaricus TaxID=27687 RepID=UPI002233E3EA|nr:F-box/WD repeat-containing protein 12 [Erpetoichthys calabaricus]